MFSSSTKYNREYAIKKIDSICDTRNEIRGYYNNLYNVIAANRNNNIEIIMSELQEKFEKEYTIALLSEELKKMREFSTGKAYECSVIINYAIAKHNDNKAAISKYALLLKEIDEKKAANKERREQIKKNKKHTRRDYMINNIDKKADTVEIVNKVLNDEVSLKDMDPKEVKSLMQTFKRYLKEIDSELYVDFIIKYYDIKSIDEKELKELREVIEYFLSYIKKNSEKINSLSPENEEDLKEIDKVIVSGVEDIDDVTKAYPKKFYNWKKKKLEKLTVAYTNYLNVIDGVIDKDFNKYKELSKTDKDFIKEDEEFLTDYIKHFKEINQAYINGIDTLTTVGDKKLDEIKLIYSNKIIKK